MLAFVSSEDVNDDNDGDDDLSGVFVNLSDESGTTVATTLTDSEGNYVFYDILAGDYTASETDPVDLVSVSDGCDKNAITVTIGGSDPLKSTNGP